MTVTLEGNPSGVSVNLFEEDDLGASQPGPPITMEGQSTLPIGLFLNTLDFSESGNSLSRFRVDGITLCGTDAVVVGDPHIKTFDGSHYTLMSQGTFSLWKHLSRENSLSRDRTCLVPTVPR